MLFPPGETPRLYGSRDDRRYRYSNSSGSECVRNRSAKIGNGKNPAAD